MVLWEEYDRMKTASLYARVSSKEQKEKGHSLETQVERMMNFASEHGYLVPDECVFQEDIPGEYEHRPKLAKVFALCEEGKIDAVIVDNWDRLARDTDLLGYFKTVMQRHHGVKVLCASESDPEDQGIAAKASRGVMGVVAQIENEMRRERSIRGRRQRARGGKIIGGFKLYGYKYNKETGFREEDPETAPVVRMIFQWLASGMSLTKIGARLVELGIPSPRGTPRWHTSVLYRIVTNRSYIGKTHMFRYRREIRNGKKVRVERPREEWIELPGATPLLVPEELFYAAQKQLEKNREFSFRKQKLPYLLKGRVRCACGRSMRGHGSLKRKQRYYHCWATHKSHRHEIEKPCNARMVRADELEEMVWNQVKAILLDPGILIAEIERRQSTGDSRLEVELASVQRTISGLDAQERRLLHLYGKGNIDEKKLDDEIGRIKTAKQSWEEQRRKLEARLEAEREIEKNRLSIEAYCERASRNIEDFTFEDKRMAIDALDIVAHVNGGRITITGRIPSHTRTTDLPPDQLQPTQPASLHYISQTSRPTRRLGGLAIR